VRSKFDRIRFAEGYDPQVLVEDPKYEDFSTWAEQLWKHEPLLDLMSEKALMYLEQDRLGNRAVETRRKAEQKLNNFWKNVDDFLAKNIKKGQHDIIRNCLSGQMRRTPPQKVGADAPQEAEHVYVPLSARYHYPSKDITGSFDKACIVEKNKAKTKGVADPSLENNEPPEAEMEDNTGTTPTVFKCDKNTYSVFQTLLKPYAANGNNLSGPIKWSALVLAMAKIGFSTQKLQSSAWQFTPHGMDVE
jgi:hypothetical protein